MKIQTVLCAQCGTVVNYADACILSDGEYHICDTCMAIEHDGEYEWEEQSGVHGVIEYDISEIESINDVRSLSLTMAYDVLDTDDNFTTLNEWFDINDSTGGGHIIYTALEAILLIEGKIESNLDQEAYTSVDAVIESIQTTGTY